MTNPSPPRKAPEPPWRTEGTPDEPPKPPSGGRGMRGGWWNLVLAALIVYLIANLLLSFFNEGDEPTISYTEFSKQVDEGNVSKIYAKGDAIQGQLKKARDNPEGDGTYTKFTTERPTFADDRLWAELTKNKVTVTAEPVVQHRSFLANMLIALAPLLLLVVLWIFRRTASPPRRRRSTRSTARCDGSWTPATRRPCASCATTGDSSTRSPSRC